MTFTPEYERWRHGGWYVTNIRYPSGAVGCVSNNYEDKKWRIVCDPRPFEVRYPTRAAAARAEWEIVEGMRAKVLAHAMEIYAEARRTIQSIDTTWLEGKQHLAWCVEQLEQALAKAEGRAA